ncbi:tetratricopeptide repeat protein [Erythrobacter mangrovi]|uniref:Tetratricopeptide repeat protein n=1 Tax=Erythrobacter mangrovi TaxID=2739433 RepID=A0A7D3XBT7_9SPHN|nr:hypothetical protein [Erythrobacter mangrovi]QKG71440.1 hypothetical protein HQR01_08720 [Erythrobacter mangrovi]
MAVLRGSGGAALGNSRGLFVQAVIAARGDDILLARQLLERSGLERTGVPAALMLSAIIDIRAKNYAIAAQTLERLYQLQPDNGRVVDLLASALSSGGRDRELIHRFARRAASDMGTPYLRTLVGRSFEALDDRVSAALYLDIAALEKGALVVLPSFTPPEAPMAGGAGAGLEARATVRHALATGQVAVALDRARGYVQRNPGSGDAYGILGDAEFAVGDKEAAREAYLHSAAVRHPWPLTLRLVRSQPHQMAARELLERFVRDHPTNGEAAAMLADTYASEARWKEAALLLDHAMRLGQARVPRVVAARSVAATKLEDHEAALGYALDAHALQPLNPFAIGALVAALPESDAATRRELEIKLRSLSKR